MAAEKVICDSDVMIDYWNGKNERHAYTKNVLENLIGLENIILSAITKMELLRGAINKEELNKINRKILQFDVAMIDSHTSEVAIEILQQYQLSHGLEIPDSIIAATAITANLPLFSHNIRDYKFISGLTLYTPEAIV